VSGTPLDRLRARVARLGVPLCLGIDPHPDQLPEELTRDLRGVETFARGIVEAAAQHAVAIKINVAFFEAFGSAGWAVLERLRADVPADQFLVLDAKRSDIGSTAERYAAGLFGHLGADAVTLSPSLGDDAIEPFLAYPDRVVYILDRTRSGCCARAGARPRHRRAKAQDHPQPESAPCAERYRIRKPVGQEGDHAAGAEGVKGAGPAMAPALAERLSRAEAAVNSSTVA